MATVFTSARLSAVMKRRAILCSIGLAALAGCVGDGGPSSTTVTDAELQVAGIDPGDQVDDATVSAEDGTVTVEGTIWGPDGCATAELERADYDADSDELTVAVATARRGDVGDVCTQAIVEIEYRVTVSVEGAVPGTVVVTHDHGDGPEQVTSASP